VMSLISKLTRVTVMVRGLGLGLRLGLGFVRLLLMRITQVLIRRTVLR